MAFGHDAWYAATEEGLLVSRDHGLNWSMVPLAPVAACSGHFRRERYLDPRGSHWQR